MVVELRSKIKLMLSRPEFADLGAKSQVRDGCLDIQAPAYLKRPCHVARARDRAFVEGCTQGARAKMRKPSTCSDKRRDCCVGQKLYLQRRSKKKMEAKSSGVDTGGGNTVITLKGGTLT